jgi:hypothetical protein
LKGSELVTSSLQKNLILNVSLHESNRDDALTKSLMNVQKAVADWAVTSNDGAMVWNIAIEFRELWYDWGVALRRPSWRVPNLVVYALDVIANDSNDEAVRVCVDLAKGKILGYRE